VTAWEIALLVDTGRIDLDSPVENWNRALPRASWHRGRAVVLPDRWPQLSVASSSRASRLGGPVYDRNCNQARLSAGKSTLDRLLIRLILPELREKRHTQVNE
jgi:hypothetical protein